VESGNVPSIAALLRGTYADQRQLDSGLSARSYTWIMMRVPKVFLSVGLAALLVGGSVAILPPLLWGDRTDYSHVVSIKDAREYQDPSLLEKAWALPVAALYYSNIDFQRNVSFCGPASIVNVLRSLREPGDQASILDGTGISTVIDYLPGGVTLDQLAEIADRKVGRKVIVLRDLDLGGFQEHLRLANDPSRRYVVNFTRGPLFGTGGGHHSPIAGYLPEQDLVLVLDVNENYGPWLVKSERLYEAMNTLDAGARKKRGLLLIE
jgi:Phytochelatin synthase